MLKNRKFQILGVIALIILATLVTLSAVRPPTTAYLPVTGSWNELVEYHRSERDRTGANTIADQNSLGDSNRTERTVIITGMYVNDPLYGYHMSEWFGGVTPVNALNAPGIQNQTLRSVILNGMYVSDPLYRYRMSEWFGK